jgi:hypothetical protein
MALFFSPTPFNTLSNEEKNDRSSAKTGKGKSTKNEWPWQAYLPKEEDTLQNRIFKFFTRAIDV